MRRFRFIALVTLSTLATLASAAPAHALAGSNHNETFLDESTD